MGNKVGVSMVTLMDLNDAIIAGVAPTNPTEGTLWIDSSLTPPVLKKWSSGAWVNQPMSLEELDPDFTEYISKGVDAAILKLGNLSSDDKITATERQVILDKLTDMLGSSPSGTVPLPAVATVNTYTAGEYYQTRKSATDAGVSTSDTAYTAYATAYTTLANYLNTITVDGIYCWDVSNAKADSVHTIVGQTFRDNWKAFYQAQLVLQTRTSKRVSDAKAEAEAYTKSYREQLVGNGYGDLGSNRNFSGFTYSTAQKVSGKGSFLRTATGETRTDEFIPVETDRTYRLSISIISSTTTGTHNLGLECYNAAGTSLGKRQILRSGTSTVLPSTTSFVHYEGVISGLNIGAGVFTDYDFPAGTTQVKIWINTNIGTTTNTVYVADVSFAIDQIEANKDYNGLTMSAAKGMVVTSTRNISEFNSTDGIKIYKKTDVGNPVFKLDANTGDLTIRGNIYMQGGTISWANMNTPSSTDKAALGIASPDDVKTAVGNIKIGGRNYYRKKNFFAQASTAVYDEVSNEWTITLGSGGTGSWRGLKYGGKDAIIKAGETATVSFDIYTDFAFTMYPDINNLPLSTGSGANDNDILASRVMPKAPVVGQWTRLFFQYTMPTTITEGYYDNSVIAIDSSYNATAGQSFKIRNIQYEIGNTPTEFSFAVEDVDDQIKKVQTDLSNVKVGGRNLLLNSGGQYRMEKNDVGLGTPSYLTTETIPFYRYTADTGKTISLYNTYDSTVLAEMPIANETYVLGVDVRTQEESTVTIYDTQNVNGSRKVYTIAPNVWTRIQYNPYVIPSVGVSMVQLILTSNKRVLDVRNVKYEKGNQMTDWTPAPEDLIKAIADVQIGGRNLLMGTEKTFTSTRVSDSENKGFSFPSGDLMNTIGRYGAGTILEDNQDYVFSFDYEFTAGYTATIGMGIGTGSGPDKYEVDRWYAQAKYSEFGQGAKGKFVVNLKTPVLNTQKYFMIRPLRDDFVAGTNTVIIKNMKLEKGNKRTDWSPAPEDIIKSLDDMEIGTENFLRNSNFEIVETSSNVTNKHEASYARWYGGYNAGIANPTTSYHAHIDSSTFGFPVYEYNESDGTRNWKGVSTVVSITESGDYTFSFDANTTLLGSKVFGGFYYRKKGGTTYSFHSGQFTLWPSVVNGWKRYKASLKLLDDVDLGQPISFYVYGYEFDTNSILYIKNLKLEKGTKATTWNPSRLDNKEKFDDFYSLTGKRNNVTVIDGSKIQTGRIDANLVTVDNLNAGNIKAGTLDVNRLTLKGLTVSDGTKDTFKVDTSGNVSIQGVVQVSSGSNVYTKSESGAVAVNANPIGVGAKFDYATFTLATTNKIYFHGYTYDETFKEQRASDTNGYFYSYDNSTKITAIKGVLDLTSGVPANADGYIIYDSANNKWGFAVYDPRPANQSWRRYNVADAPRHNVALTIDSTIYIMGELSL